MRDLSSVSSIESEAGIIASLIHRPEFTFYSERLLPEYFTDKFHKEIFQAITNLVGKGIETIDAYNIKEILGDESTITVEQLQELIDVSDTIARSSVPEYKLLVSKVTELAFRRDIYRKLKECEALCLTDDEESIEQEIYRVIDDTMVKYSGGKDIPLFKDVIDQLWQEIEDRQNGVNAGSLFKFPTLNEYVTIEKGELIVVGGSAKSGKSMFLTNCAIELLKENKSVFYIDSELNSRLWLTRVMSHLTGIEFIKMKSGKYSEEERIKIDRWRAWLKEKQLVHLYMPLFDMEAIYTAVKKINHIYPLDALIVDYFKAGDSLEAYTNYAELGRLVDMVKNRICGDMGLMGLAAAQSTAQGTKLADSEKIARNASTILMMINKTPEEIEEDGEECGNKKLIVSQNRNGMQHAPGEYIDLKFNGDLILFEEAKQHTPKSPY